MYARHALLTVNQDGAKLQKRVTKANSKGHLTPYGGPTGGQFMDI